MADESDLRKLFAEADAPNTLDASRVISRSRRRRLPQQLAAGGIGVLAIAGIAVIAVPALVPGQTGSTVSLESAPAEDSSGGEAFDTTIKRAPADKLNLCEGALAEVAPSVSGLELDVVFPESAEARPEPVLGVVRLTNTGATPVSGITGPSPAITLSQDGVVLWHSNGPVDMSAVVVDLEPGQSQEYSASFVPVKCSIEDDLAEAFRSDLPVVPPGVYQLSAAIDFTPEIVGPTPDLDLVTGPLSSITIG